MGQGNFTEDFKLDAIKQITERGHSVADVSKRLGVSTHSLYSWMDIFDYIEMFYNPQRKHVRNGMLSPVEFEKLQKLNPQGV